MEGTGMTTVAATIVSALSAQHHANPDKHHDTNSDTHNTFDKSTHSNTTGYIDMLYEYSSINVICMLTQLLCLGTDSCTGLVLRDIVNFPSELRRHRSHKFTGVAPFVLPD